MWTAFFLCDIFAILLLGGSVDGRRRVVHFGSDMYIPKAVIGFIDYSLGVFRKKNICAALIVKL